MKTRQERRETYERYGAEKIKQLEYIDLFPFNLPNGEIVYMCAKEIQERLHQEGRL
jgi:hypothetical protein